MCIDDNQDSDINYNHTWVEKLIELYSSTDALNTAKGDSLRRSHLVSLYRYSAAEEKGEATYGFRNFQNRQFWLSHTSDFNDPYDSEFLISNEPDDFNEIFQSVQHQRTKVFCFSERRDSVLMWSHYADKHRGFCLEYDFANHGGDLGWLDLYPVFYAKSAVKPDIADFRCHRARYEFYRFLPAMIKHHEWEYEAEWRLIKPLFQGDTLPSPTPRAVYIGSRMEADVARDIVSVAKEQGISTIYKERHNTRDYKIEFDIWQPSS